MPAFAGDDSEVNSAVGASSIETPVRDDSSFGTSSTLTSATGNEDSEEHDFEEEQEDFEEYSTLLNDEEHEKNGDEQNVVRSAGKSGNQQNESILQKSLPQHNDNSLDTSHKSRNNESSQTADCEERDKTNETDISADHFCRDDEINGSYHYWYLQNDGLEFQMPILFEDGMDFIECELYYASIQSHLSGGRSILRRRDQRRRKVTSPTQLLSTSNGGPSNSNGLQSCLRHPCRSKYNVNNDTGNSNDNSSKRQDDPLNNGNNLNASQIKSSPLPDGDDRRLLLRKPALQRNSFSGLPQLDVLYNQEQQPSPNLSNSESIDNSYDDGNSNNCDPKLLSQAGSPANNESDDANTNSSRENVALKIATTSSNVKSGGRTIPYNPANGFASSKSSRSSPLPSSPRPNLFERSNSVARLFDNGSSRERMTGPTSVVSFEEFVHVVTIHSVDDYPDEIRKSIWMSRKELSRSIVRARRSRTSAKAEVSSPDMMRIDGGKIPPARERRQRSRRRRRRKPATDTDPQAVEDEIENECDGEDAATEPQPPPPPPSSPPQSTPSPSSHPPSTPPPSSHPTS